MRVIGFTTIHYGTEYLKESLESVKDFCEKVVIAYTPYPSHGYSSRLICPDTKEDIFEIASKVLGDKMIWDEGIYHNEGQHRNKIEQYQSGYDLVLSIDADEVFETKELQNALEYAYNGKASRYGIKGYINFWRCFDFACTDGFRPIRIRNLNNNNQVQDLECPLTIYHFSTAQSEAIMRYKYSVFGHASEIRENWLESIHYGWKRDNELKNLHCVAHNIWNAEHFDKTTLPESLKNHPNYNKEYI